MAPFRSVALVLLSLMFFSWKAIGQTPCTTLGQTPSTAFPVCGTSTFTQTTVPICSTNSLFVPGCSGTGGAYANKNPFWYKFTCFTSGTLGFVITPLAANEDYDWQLYDITGRNPNDIFTDNTMVVTGNWAGTYGPTGASSSGSTTIQCASDPAANNPTFARWPSLVAGREYLLLVSHFTDTQSGYTLQFGGGTAVITDPTEPHLLTVKPDCDGTTLRLKLNKKMRCNSITMSGSEFSILPAVSNVISATTNTCSGAFDFSEVVITLDNPLPNGNYQLVVKNGSDANTLLDHCARPIPPNEQIPFFYAVPQPIFADSIGRPGCAPTEVKLYFPKRITCSTVAPDGSDFQVTGPSPVTVVGASGNCVGGLTDTITIRFAAPIVAKGTYQLRLRAGTDGSTIIDECNIPMPQQSLNFVAVDTVNAGFTYTEDLGCRQNSLFFSHDGAHDVNRWTWIINSTDTVRTSSHTAVFPATSDNTVQLMVSNGVCADTVTRSVIMNNEVKAAFEMPPVICPEDLFIARDTSAGLIDSWHWSFGNISSSNLENPAPVQFPQNNVEAYYTIKLRVTNNLLGCADSISKQLRVLNNCFIAVPNAFTPNNDGLNDFLYPNNAVKAQNLDFRIFNRWGQLVFSTSNWQDKWDGKIGGIPQAPGVYVWHLRYTHSDSGQKVFQKGTTVLIR